MSQVAIEYSVGKLLASHHVKVAKRYLQFLIRSHPNYPSVLTITDTLDEIGVESSAILVSKDDLEQLPNSFLICGTGQDDVRFFKSKEAKKSALLQKIFDGSKGVVIAIVINGKKIQSNPSNEKELRIERWKGKINSASLLLVAASIFVAAALCNLQTIMVFFLSLLGVGLFVSIHFGQSGRKNKVVDGLCSVNKSINESACDQLFKSDESKIFGNVRWSDLGVIYFSQVALAVLLLGPLVGSNVLFSCLLLGSFGTIPIIGYSIYKQVSVKKSVCILCIFSILITAAQTAIIITFLSDNTLLFSSNSLFIYFFTLLSVVIVWTYLRIFSIDFGFLVKSNFSLWKFKKDPNVFLRLLVRERQILFVRKSNDLQIGNSNSPFQFLIVCNPFCSPCAIAHRVFHEIAERYGDKVGITVRFAFLKSKGDKQIEAMKLIYRTYGSMQDRFAGQRSAMCRSLLFSWYEHMNLERFKTQYEEVGVNGTMNFEELDEQIRWASEVDVEYTPTMFLNGYQLPAWYSHFDINSIIGVLLFSEDNYTNNFPRRELDRIFQ